MSGQADQRPSSEDHPGVRIPPPLIFLTFLVAGLLFDSSWINGELATMPEMIVGAILFLCAGLIAYKSVPRHKKEGSNVEPWKPTTKIISDGVYGRSRNPIYVAMVLLFVSIAVMGGSIAALVALVPCLVIIRYYVIAREERYLEAKFGDEYLDYKQKVRRWV